MIKKFNLFIFLLFVAACANLEFTYDNNAEINNPIFNKTKVTLSGKELTSVYMIIPEIIGVSQEDSYELYININESKKRRSVQNNQAVAKVDHKLNFKYELYNINKNCNIYRKEIISRFTYVPKSSGFNFGSDKSLENKYELAVKKNLKDFVDSMPAEDSFVCINEG